MIPASMIPNEITPEPSSAVLVAANGSMITNAGSISISVSTEGGPEAKVSAVVSPDVVGPMLVSWHDLIALDIIPKSFPKPRKSTVLNIVNLEGRGSDSIEKIKADYSDVLVDSLGKASGTIAGPKMTIKLDESAKVKPCQVTTARPVQIHLKAKADDLIKELISAEVIVPCTEPTRWTSPAHFVKKPGGKEARLVTDY